MKKTLSILIYLLFAITTVEAQIYDGTPCKSEHLIENKFRSIFPSTLESRLNNFRMETPYPNNPENYIFYSSTWASSMRNPDGLAPKKKTSFYVEGLGMETTYTYSYIKFSCKYSPYSVIDGKIDTAWSEGVNDDGIGEFIILPIKNLKDRLRIFSGFGKSKKLFLENNRPKNVSVYLFLAKDISHAQDSIIYSNLIFLDKFDFDLNDTFDYQYINFPKDLITKEQELKTVNPVIVQELSFIAIRINSVYKGSKYSDTLISEVSAE